MENREHTLTQKEAEQDLISLKVEWQKCFKLPSPAKSSREFLLKNISWYKQARDHGINIKRFHKIMETAFSVPSKEKSPMVKKQVGDFI